MNGPTVIGLVVVIVCLGVAAFEIWDRGRERREFDSVNEWERLKRDLAPRSIP